MKPWWRHYKLRDEPQLSPEPLIEPKDYELFFGREAEVQRITTRTETKTRVTLLITGLPGVGKTSLIHRVFAGKKGFIRANLSKAPSILDADVEIAESCISKLKEVSKSKASQLRKRLLSTTSKTTGRNLQAKGTPGGIGASITSLYQETMAPIRSIEVRDVIRESLQAMLSKGHRPQLFLDESDFFDGENPHELVHLCQRIKGLLPRGGIMILASRDIDGLLGSEYHNSQSLIRSTFRYFCLLPSLWSPGQADIPQLIDKRLKRGKPLKGYRFPLQKNACYVLDILSSGNIKLLLQYIEIALMEGAIKDQKVPLSSDFVKSVITAHFEEAQIQGGDEKTVLKYLRNKPTHVNDKKFRNIIGSRTNLQAVLGCLEIHNLVRRDTKRSGVKHIYSVTEKANMLLSK